MDSYAFPPQAFAAAWDEFPVVVAVDDTGDFPLPADVVVNAAIGLEPPAVAAATRYLLGPAFALLDPSFSVPPERRQGGEVRRVLVTLGGATPAVLMGVVARATRAALPNAALDLVVGPAGDGPHEVGRIVEGLGATVHRAPESMRILMLAADIAVSAGGVTAYELAATGTPTVGVTVARNQLINVRGLARAGALWSAGDAADPRLPTILQGAVSALAADAEARARMGAQARALVDGCGATRVADEIRSRLEAGATTAPGRTC